MNHDHGTGNEKGVAHFTLPQAAHTLTKNQLPPLPLLGSLVHSSIFWNVWLLMEPSAPTRQLPLGPRRFIPDCYLTGAPSNLSDTRPLGSGDSGDLSPLGSAILKPRLLTLRARQHWGSSGHPAVQRALPHCRRGHSDTKGRRLCCSA